MLKGQSDDLSGGVFKKRLNRNLHRSIILAKGGRYWIYQYLFTKKDRANIAEDELEDFRTLAKGYASLSEKLLILLSLSALKEESRARCPYLERRQAQEGLFGSFSQKRTAFFLILAAALVAIRHESDSRPPGIEFRLCIGTVYIKRTLMFAGCAMIKVFASFFKKKCFLAPSECIARGVVPKSDGSDCKFPPGAMMPVIDPGRCEAKGPCVVACPFDVLAIRVVPAVERAALPFFDRVKLFVHGGKQVFAVDVDACRGCGLCVQVCPEEAIKLLSGWISSPLRQREQTILIVCCFG